MDFLLKIIDTIVALCIAGLLILFFNGGSIYISDGVLNIDFNSLSYEYTFGQGETVYSSKEDITVEEYDAQLLAYCPYTTTEENANNHLRYLSCGYEPQYTIYYSLPVATETEDVSSNDTFAYIEFQSTPKEIEAVGDYVYFYYDILYQQFENEKLVTYTFFQCEKIYAPYQEIDINVVVPSAPEKLRTQFVDAGWKMAVDPSNKSFNKSSGVDASGLTSYNDHTILFRLYYQDEDVAYHELGHYVDKMLVTGETLSDSEEFQQIYAEEHDNYAPTVSVDTSTAAEYFAEAYSSYIRDSDTLYKLAPKTCEYFQMLTAQYLS